MTKRLNPDSDPSKSGFLPFAPGELDRSGLRLTRAEFARFMDVSKQSVGEWVTAGKITLGVDGRLDPRQAVSQLLRNSDPARLRARVLAPLVKDLGNLQQRVTELEADLAAAGEEADFYEAVSLELLAEQDALRRGLVDVRDDLELLPTGKVISAIVAWLDAVASGSASPDLEILDCIPESAPVDAPNKVEKGGEAEVLFPSPAEITALYAIASGDEDETASAAPGEMKKGAGNALNLFEPLLPDE